MVGGVLELEELEVSLDMCTLLGDLWRIGDASMEHYMRIEWTSKELLRVEYSRYRLGDWSSGSMNWYMWIEGDIWRIEDASMEHYRRIGWASKELSLSIKSNDCTFKIIFMSLKQAWNRVKVADCWAGAVLQHYKTTVQQYFTLT